MDVDAETASWAVSPAVTVTCTVPEANGCTESTSGACSACAATLGRCGAATAALTEPAPNPSATTMTRAVLPHARLPRVLLESHIHNAPPHAGTHHPACSLNG